MAEQEPYIFISYRSLERAFAAKLAEDLRNANFRVWFDQDGIETGNVWTKKLEDGIDNAAAFLPILSPEYLEGLFTRRELARADSNELPMFPIRYKHFDKMPIELQNVQYTDFSDPEHYDTNVQKLISILKETVPRTRIAFSSNLSESPRPEKRLSTSSAPQAESKGCRAELSFTIIAAALAFFVMSLAIWFYISTNKAEVPSISGMDIAREAEYLPLSSQIKDPSPLVLATHNGQAAVWGYDRVSGLLFALDAGTGELLDLGAGNSASDSHFISLQTLIDNDFWPGAIHYDGQWLWLADSGANRLVALNPDSLETMMIYQLDTASPLAIASTKDVLWIALRDKDSIMALDINHESAEASPHCGGNISVGIDPNHFTVEDTGRLWVAYGRGDGGGMLLLDTVNCEILQSIALPARPDSSTFLDGQLWVIAGANLWQMNASTDTAKQLKLQIDESVQLTAITAANGNLWLASSNSGLYVVQPETAKIELTIDTQSQIRSMLPLDTVVWVTDADAKLIRYFSPDAIVPELSAIAASGNTLWYAKSDGTICPLDTPERGCFSVSLADGDRATVLSPSDDPKTIWLGTEQGAIWLINLESQKAELSYELPHAILGLTETDSAYLWVSDYFTSLTVVDMQHDKQENVLNSAFNIRVPMAMGSDGHSLWLSNNDSAQLSIATYDGTNFVEDFAGINSSIRELKAITVSDKLVAILGDGQLQLFDKVTNAILLSHFLDPAVDSLLIVDNKIWLADSAKHFVYQFEFTI